MFWQWGFVGLDLWPRFGLLVVVGGSWLICVCVLAVCGLLLVNSVG